MSLSQSSFLPFAPEWMHRYSCESLIYIFTAWLQPFVNEKEWHCMIKHECLDSDKRPSMSVWAAPVGEKGIAGIFKRKSLLWCLILTKTTQKSRSVCGDVTRPPSCTWTHLDATCLSLANKNIAAFSFTRWKTLYFGNVSCARVPFKCNMQHL